MGAESRTGRVRYSDKNYSFEFSAANLYEASGDIGSMLFMMLVGGSPGDSEGFVLYADEEMKEEVLSYTKAYGKIVCGYWRPRTRGYGIYGLRE